MNRDQIENQIEQLLINFNNQFTRAKNYKSIPQIELDLMMATIRDLYEQLHRLNNNQPMSLEKIQLNTAAADEKIISSENMAHAIISEAASASVIDRKSVV